MTLRRLTLFPTLALALLVAGCGGDGDDGAASGTLGEPFSYLPKDTAVVVTFDTDTSGSQFENLDKHLSKFPFAGPDGTRVPASAWIVSAVAPAS